MPDTPTAREVKHIRPAPETRVFNPAAVVASCVGFVLIGALQALYGPAIPAFRDAHDLSPSAAGLGLSAHFIGVSSACCSSTGSSAAWATAGSSAPPTC